MDTKHQCGPNHDSEFFDEVTALFQRFPEMAGKYSIKCMDHETNIMKVDLERNIGISRIEGDRVITEFRNREPERIWQERCCEWCVSPITGKRYCCTAWAGPGPGGD